MDPLFKSFKENLGDFNKRIYNELTILLYHGVTNYKSKGIENFSAKHIDENIFIEQMKFIKKECNVISIDDFIELKSNNAKLPPKSVIVSFDDGFKNNYEVAAPILSDLQIPAIFYVASGIVNTDLMFWVDIIEDCINNTHSSIDIELEKPYSFTLLTETNKINALTKIKSFCKTVNFNENKIVLKALQKVTNFDAGVEHSKNYEKIKWTELDEMNKDVNFTIGGHSLYHNILSQLEDRSLEKEISCSLDLLNINLNEVIRHYSYPEGQSNHFNKKTIDTLKKYNIVCSPTAIPGLNTIETDLFYLKRIMIGFNNLPFPYFS